ncbi:MAG: hypothetical protein GY861_02590 [bacterium]|nr:hypothetical protein [bacterium]
MQWFEIIAKRREEKKLQQAIREVRRNKTKGSFTTYTIKELWALCCVVGCLVVWLVLVLGIAGIIVWVLVGFNNELELEECNKICAPYKALECEKGEQAICSERKTK